MRFFIPTPRPAREIPDGAKPLNMKTERRIIGGPERHFLGYAGPGDRHLFVPGIPSSEIEIVAKGKRDLLLPSA
jgi:hypothetical protein